MMVEGRLQHDGSVLVSTQRCVRCGASSLVRVELERFEMYNHGELIQNVWPQWSVDKRELMISGMHPYCWFEVFSYDPEYEPSAETMGYVFAVRLWERARTDEQLEYYEGEEA